MIELIQTNIQFIIISLFLLIITILLLLILMIGLPTRTITGQKAIVAEHEYSQCKECRGPFISSDDRYKGICYKCIEKQEELIEYMSKKRRLSK